MKRSKAPTTLVVLSDDGKDARGSCIADVIKKTRGITTLLSCNAENMVVGPATTGPFTTMHLVKVRDLDAAEALTVELLMTDGRPRISVYAGRQMPAITRRLMGALHFVYRMMPAPRPSAPVTIDDEHLGGVNPTAEQLTDLMEQPPDPPVYALNLNLHKEEGVHPETGETQSGHALSEQYFRRGMYTFSRLGARVSWAGSLHETLADELNLGTWDQAGIIYYPSRRAFMHLMDVPEYVAAGTFRTAGLERSWVVHCTE